MENHKKITEINQNLKPSKTDNFTEYFDKALKFTKTYYQEDFDRIANTNFDQISVDFFFREYIWATYTSGFNAKIVSKLFPKLLEIYQPLFETASQNKKNINTIDIAVKSMSVISNKNKIKAIIDTAFVLGEEIAKSNWNDYKNTNLNTPEKLQKFSYIGPITCFHLARNIGLLEFVKPDLHLERLAKHFNFTDTLELCKEIQKTNNIPLGLIDLALWYYASTFGTREIK